MKIVFMGTPEYAVGALEALWKAGHDIRAVVTQPDKPKGRGKEVQMSPVKQFAVSHDISVFQPVRIKKPEAVEQLKTYEADVFVVAAFGQILSQEILDMPRFGCINIHASLLPKYRGAAPIQWAIINGEEKTGVTIMQMDAGVDTGDMLFKSEVAIAPEDTYASLQDKLARAGADLIVPALAAQQLVDGYAEVFALDIPEGDVQCGNAGENHGAAILAPESGLVELVPDDFVIQGIHTDDKGGQIPDHACGSRCGSTIGQSGFPITIDSLVGIDAAEHRPPRGTAGMDLEYVYLRDFHTDNPPSNNLFLTSCSWKQP